MQDIIKALEDYYRECGSDRSLEYTYGYMDALSVVRANAPVRPMGQRYSHTESDKAISDTKGHIQTVL